MRATSTGSAPISAAAALRARSYCCDWKLLSSFHDRPPAPPTAADSTRRHSGSRRRAGYRTARVGREAYDHLRRVRNQSSLSVIPSVAKRSPGILSAADKVSPLRLPSTSLGAGAAFGFGRDDGSLHYLRCN